MRLALVVSAGWLSVGLVLADLPWVAFVIGCVLAVYAMWPEPCLFGHELVAYEYRDTVMARNWSGWRCRVCHRLTNDVVAQWRRPGWQR